MEEKCSKEEAREVFENDPETVSLSLDHHVKVACGFLSPQSTKQHHTLCAFFLREVSAFLETHLYHGAQECESICKVGCLHHVHTDCKWMKLVKHQTNDSLSGLLLLFMLQ